MTKKLKKILIIFSLLAAVFLAAVFFYGKSYALALTDEEAFVQGITIIAPKTDINLQKEIADSNRNWFKDFTWQKLLEELRKQSGVAFKAMLGNFLNNLAYDTGNYLATGNWGQGPMIETRDFGTVLKNAADNAAGTFIEQMGNNNYVKFNLCKPDLRVLLKINLGLRATVLPKAPPCTFSKLTQNWEQALKSKNFLPQFQDMFNPWSNDLGIALTLQTGLSAEMDKRTNIAAQELIKNSGFKDVKDQISGYIKSPSSIVGMQADAVLKEKGAKEKTYTGTIADAIDVFINTLAGKLLDKWLKKGLVSNFPPLTSALDSLTNPYAQSQNEGAAGAADRMSSLLEPNFKVRGDYNVLNELATCPDPNKAGPTNCVIDEKFRQAIEKRLTVGQALKQGYLGGGKFGFITAGSKQNNTKEPMFNEGYPYRSMLILRKFRILPVGWEIAAQKINDTAESTHTLGDLIACFSKDDKDEEWGVKDYWEDWCNGLVDPNWVLKAPQNFCKREGAGPIVTSEQIMGQGADSSLSILRGENYCADEQSIIKERSDGSNVYGYCTEERRIWDFNSKSCQPRDNTCQTFKSPDGQTVSYLQNTLDYGNCSAGNAGCLRYARAGVYVNGAIDWTLETPSVYLNHNAQECEAAGEGCHQLIRLNSGGGANLLVNSDFEQNLAIGGWSDFGAPSEDAYQGGQSLQVSAMTRTIIAGKDDYDIAGESWTLSFYSKNCSGAFKIEGKSSSLAPGAAWTFNKLTYVYPQDAATNEINFSIDSSPCLIDNIKLEKAESPTAYSDYAAANASLIYEKLLPEYLADICWTDIDQNNAQLDYYKPTDNAPAECSNFARQCKQTEAGCEFYSGVTNGLKIPAQVKAQDYCWPECVGYNTFIQSQTSFANSQDAYFIPKTAKTCSAQAAGCEQFTNLDEEAKGGEGIEYYTSLRQCRKPDGECAEFYTWEGSDESGFQLKVFQLQNNSGHPATTDKDLPECEYGLVPGQAGYEANKDCREFYSRSGQVSHYLFSSTISCSDNCHPYRRAQGHSVSSGTPSVQSECADHGGAWSAENGCVYNAIPGQGRTCAAAANGCREYTGNTGNNVRNIFTDDFSGGVGVWTGQVSPSSDSPTLGHDNIGHSLKITVSSGGKTTVRRSVGNAVTQGKPYVLKFLAKAEADASLTASLGNGLSTSTFAVSPQITADWQIYAINLASLNHQPAASETLELYVSMPDNKSFYLTNLTLTEIVDRYYLIKDSWRTPAVCDSEADGVTPHAQFMLGCDQYQDRSAKTHNLKQFNKLCSESAVGCEMMIDTKNSANPAEEIFNAADTASKLTVPADDFIYAVYDQSKLCGQEDKGCERLGKPYQYDGTTIYGDVYLKNNPDNYGRILCDSGAVGCQAFAYNNGPSASGEQYFKDPGDQACEWRTAAGQGASQDWFKKKVKRCDAQFSSTDKNSDGKIDGKADKSGPESYDSQLCLASQDCNMLGSEVNCTNDTACGKNGKGQYNKCVNDKCYASCETDTDCNVNKDQYNSCVNNVCRNSCITDNNDYKCPLDTDAGKLAKTLGAGGNSPVSQPAKDGKNTTDTKDDVNWAGVCQPSASGCSEYLDPVSEFNTNIIFNGSFADLDNDSTTQSDGWSNDLKQNVTLEPNTVYRLARADKGAGELAIGNCKVNNVPISALYGITGSNILTGPANATSTPFDADHINSRIFYYKGSDKASCEISVSGSAGAVELKPVVIDYQLKQNLDSATCNGQPDFNKGCVMFNERSQDGAGKAKLNDDADTEKLGEASIAAERDSNIILKVTPDRTCDKWLAPRSYVKDEKGNDVIFDVGLCNAVDDNGNCSSFLTPTKTNQQAVNAEDAEKISNLSGYSEVGLLNGSLITDYYPLGAMEQTGELANLANGGFETAGTNGYPIGWTYEGTGFTTKAVPPAYPGAPATTATSWNANIFSVINNPIAAQKEGIGYAPEGRNFLKLGSSYTAESEMIDVMPNTPYIITAYVNTKNLKTGQAMIDITGQSGPVITQDLGNDWQFKLAKFTTGNESQIRVKLYAAADGGGALDSAQGNFYYDGIKIRPALNSRDKNAAEEWYTNQSCRLYPQTDSLSCDYYDDAGKRQKGWYGYCLQYDRPPGDPNACLLWYPIDKVKGDGLEESAGYQGRAPLYYCLEAKGYCLGAERKYYCSKLVQVVTATGQNKVWSGNVYQGSSYQLFSSKDSYIDWGQDFGGQEDITIIYSRDGSPFGSIVPPSPASNPYEWDGQANTDQNTNTQPLNVAHLESEKTLARAGTPYYGTSLDCRITKLSTPECSGSATVTCPQGTVRISFRDTVNDGKTSVVASDNGCTASEPSNHGGSCGCEVTCQNMTNNNAFNIAPSFDEAKAGVGRLFAQSYGGWEWQGDQKNGRYVPAGGLSWGPPQIKCADQSARSVNTNDYCAILPRVDNDKDDANGNNIKVNGKTDNPIIKNTDFINLTFNSNVDSQQLPLVMYAIDWGDGSNTAVTGVSMRDRTNSSLPHSLYHLYSYWDLKAKDNQNKLPSGSDCIAKCSDKFADAGDAGCCYIKPKVQIKDNWGWYNHGTDINTAGDWDSFAGEVVVKEK
ncbi:MAG: hypothetical protein Q7R92_00660 [bacterium]|nr:hypothetical protein [bacterium]